MRNACSATHLVRHRPGFGWRVQPAPGSVLASPRVAEWNPEPDYFHHWARDAAIVLKSVPLAMRADPQAGASWRQFIADFVDFTRATTDPVRKGPVANPLRAGAQPGVQQYLRPDAELAALTGADWLEEPRFAPDGGPDLERWSRPQDDGPALRASALMAVLEALPETASPQAEALIARDIAHTLRVAGRASIGPWEELPPRRTTFTLIAQWDALSRAAVRMQRVDLQDAADQLAALIQTAADPVTGGWRESLEAPAGRLDSSTCLAILHAGRKRGPFALTAPRTRATLDALSAQFAALYPISATASVPAIGRWSQDVYFDGNPWFPATLGFAAICYGIAAQTREGQAMAQAEEWMALIEQVAPRPEGPLPEQFDRRTGAPTSCLDLTWSAAAFLEAAEARDHALQAMPGVR